MLSYRKVQLIQSPIQSALKGNGTASPWRPWLSTPPWNERRKEQNISLSPNFYVPLNYSFKPLFLSKTFFCLGGCELGAGSSGPSPGQAEAPVKREEIWGQQPLRDSWWTGPGGFLIHNLGSTQKRRGKRDIPGERCSLLQGKAGFGSIQVALLNRTVFNTWNNLLLRDLRVWLCSKQSCHTSKELGLPKEQFYVVCSGLITPGQESAVTCWRLEQMSSLQRPGAGNHIRKAKTHSPKGLLLQLWPIHHSNVLYNIKMD